MPRKKKIVKEVNAEQICDYLIANEKIFDRSCQDLFCTFQGKESYKHLKNIGLEQISSTMEWTSTPYEEVQKRARLQYEKIRQVTSSLEDEFDQIIREKLNGAFRATVKEEILKFIQRQNSLVNEEVPENILESTLMSIKKEYIERNDEVENQENEDLSGALQSQSNSFLEEISLSSVHTSDLSSYEDDISISSEEGNIKRKVSLKFAEEEIERVRQNRLSEAVNKEKHKRKNRSSDDCLMQSPDSTSTSLNTSLRRVRKPNFKYFSNVVSPFDVDFQTHVSTSKSQGHAVKVVPRKRGRPRKYN